MLNSLLATAFFVVVSQALWSLLRVSFPFLATVPFFFGLIATNLSLFTISICSVYYATRSYSSQSKQEAKVVVRDHAGAPVSPQRSPVTLSVVVPCYNEEQRLPAMLDEAIAFLSERYAKDSTYTWEIIVVDDCSSDATVNVATKRAALVPSKRDCGGELLYISYSPNHGKGYAVKQGVFGAVGACVLFADGDGASAFHDLCALERACLARLGLGSCKDASGYHKVVPSGTEVSALRMANVVACGSRADLEATDTIAERTFLRNLLMHVFHFVVDFTFLFILGYRSRIRDTQCGFKLISAAAAVKAFEKVHIERWAFDVELLVIAASQKVPIVEVPISWLEIEGSKMKCV